MADSNKLGEIFVEIKTEQSKLRAEINSLKNQMSKDAKEVGNSFGSSLKTSFGNAFKTLAASFGIIAIFRKGLNIIKESISLAKEQAIAESKVKKAVETTGMAAGYTAKQLYSMARELQGLTAIGDEKILQNVTNNLLTFKNISGEAFKRAQKAILDLNAVIANGEIGALTSQTIQLGKALNDPIVGLTALRRVGISFSDQETEQIKNLVQTNQLFKAQSFMLDLIEGQYGGQAEALNKATQGTKGLSASIGDFLEGVGNQFLGFFGSIAGPLTKFFQLFTAGNTKLEDAQAEAFQLSYNFDQLSQTYLRLAGNINRSESENKLFEQTIRDLEKQYPNYLRNVNLHKDGIDKVKDALHDAKIELDKFIESMIQQAIIEENKDKLVEIAKSTYQYQMILNHLQNDLDEFNKTGTDPFSKLTLAQKKLLVDQKDIYFYFRSANIFTPLGEQIDNVKDKIKSLEGDNKTLTDFIAKMVTSIKKVTSPTGGNKNIVDPQTPLTMEEINKQLETQISLYEELGTHLGKWYSASVELIHNQRDEWLKAGLTKSEVDELERKKLDELLKKYDELNQRVIDRVKATKELQSVSVPQQPEIQKTETQTFMESVQDPFSGENGFINTAKGAMDTVQGFVHGFFEDFRITANQNTNAVVKGFIGMANAFISAVEEMIAKWLAFITLQKVAGLFGIPLIGGATGGSFVGTSSGVKKASLGGSFQNGIKKMATGGSFIVPSAGIQGDYFPLLLKAGEKADITPVGQVGNDKKMFQALINRVEALTLVSMKRKPQPIELLLDGRTIAKVMIQYENEFDRGNVVVPK